MASDDGLRPLIHQHLKVGFHWQAIESGMTAGGIPDSNFCAGGVEGWVESKATSTWHVAFRPLQPSWLARRSRAGGRVFVAVRQRTPSADVLWLLRGAYAPDIALKGLKRLPEGALLGRWEGGPARWRWPEVATLLLHAELGPTC